MARDPGALPIQGPDLGGNPVPVTTVAGSNLVRITGNAGATLDTNNLAETISGLLTVLNGGEYTSTVGGAGSDTTLLYAGAAGKRLHLLHLSYFYSLSPQTGTLTVTANGVVVLRWLVPQGGAGPVVVPLPAGGLKTVGANQSIALLLPAGGSLVVGTLNSAICAF